jgi:hypothetical protein
MITTSIICSLYIAVVAVVHSDCFQVYRLITRGTYEKQMFEKASKKLGLDHVSILSFSLASSLSFSLCAMHRTSSPQPQAVLRNIGSWNPDDSRSRKSFSQMGKEIDSLLRYGAYDIFQDDDSAAIKFCAEDIDQILQRAKVLHRDKEI